MNKKQLLDTLNERPKFSIKEKGGNVKLVEIKKVEVELKRIEKRLNKKFKKDDLEFVLQFSNKEERESYYDVLYVTLYHPDIVPTGSFDTFKNGITKEVLKDWELRCEKLAKQHLKDWLGRQDEN